MRRGERASRTAETVVWLRALGAREADPALRNPDTMAIDFIGPAARGLRFVPGAWSVARRIFDAMAPGYYRYETARSKHLDGVLEGELEAGLEQLVLIGAGYDSRAYRFASRLAGAPTFEIDRPAVLARKRSRADRAGLDSTVVVPVPFELAEDPLDALQRSGYSASARTLFLCSGVVMYLEVSAVGELLATVRAAGEGSSICFDYVYSSALHESERFYGAKRMFQNVERMGEPYRFAVDPSELEPFLTGRGCRLLSNLGARELSTYLRSGKSPGDAPQMCDYLGIAHATPLASGAAT